MTTDQQQSAPTFAIGGIWLTDSRSGIDHCWRDVVDGGLWRSRCPAGITADPATLMTPEDVYGRCQGCVLALAIEQGAEIADRLGVTDWRP